MLESKYLQRFEKLDPKEFDLYSDRIIIERLEYEAKTKSGIVIHVDTTTRRDNYAVEKAHFAVALLIGKGYYDEKTGKDIPLSIKQGDILVIPPVNTYWFSEFGPLTQFKSGSLGLISEGDIHLNFGSLDKFTKFFDTLNG